MILLILLFSLAGHASEPDNFTRRNTPPQNQVVNQYVQQMLKEVAFYHNANNKDSQKCDETLLTKLVERKFNTNWADVGPLDLAVKAKNSSDHDKNYLLRGLVYEKYFTSSYTLKLQGKNYSVGLDKIDHFFSHGALYWKVLDQNPNYSQEKMLKALELGLQQESGPWGLKLSGVKSYADLVANYQGVKFWRDLRHGKPPFLSCEKGKFVVKKQFRIEDYMTGAVDEAMNCSSYESPKMAQTILQRTEALKRKCPLDMRACEQFRKDFAGYEKHLLHPLCLGQASDQVEIASRLTTKELMDIASALASGNENLLKTFFPQEATSIGQPKSQPQAKPKPKKQKVTE